MCRHEAGGHTPGGFKIDGNNLSLFRIPCLQPWFVFGYCNLSFGRLFRFGRHFKFGRLVKFGRLGLCRERLILLLRRSLERGVTLVAVTGTGY